MKHIFPLTLHISTHIFSKLGAESCKNLHCFFSKICDFRVYFQESFGKSHGFVFLSGKKNVWNVHRSCKQDLILCPLPLRSTIKGKHLIFSIFTDSSTVKQRYQMDFSCSIYFIGKVFSKYQIKSMCNCFPG